jgi:hypothetical protein
MLGQTEERWAQLCSEVANERNAERLLELVGEINRLLEEQELWLKPASRRLRDA